MGKSIKTRRNNILNLGIKSPNLLIAALLIFTIPLLSACSFKPLYGTTSSNQQLESILASINIVEVPGRVGQKLRNELIFRFTGGNHPEAPQYRLIMAVTENVSSQLVQRDGDSRGQFLELTTNFKLYTISDEKTPILKGTSHSKAAFRDDESVYANVRARRDAENRAAKTTAEELQNRISAFLSRNS